MLDRGASGFIFPMRTVRGSNEDRSMAMLWSGVTSQLAFRVKLMKPQNTRSAQHKVSVDRLR